MVTTVEGMDFTGLTTFIHITTGPNEPGVIVPLMRNYTLFSIYLSSFTK